MSRPLATAVTWVSSALQWVAPCLPDLARWQVPARAKPLAIQRKHSVMQWFDAMDQVIVLCDWTQRLLRLNGVPEAQMKLVRHGLTQLPAAPPTRVARGELKLAFFGRLDPTKGLHVVLEALALAPTLPVSLELFALGADAVGKYPDRIRALVSRDARVSWRAPVPAADVPAVIAGFDALVVPSIGFETGPLVVLEAFAMGVPVIGSRLGGIAEWVIDGVNGLLATADDPSDWQRVIECWASDAQLRSALALGIRSPRSMADVALENLIIYKGHSPTSVLSGDVSSVSMIQGSARSPA
jgi:glycosyltransferase involved in cell wall biosynthesis